MSINDKEGGTTFLTRNEEVQGWVLIGLPKRFIFKTPRVILQLNIV